MNLRAFTMVVSPLAAGSIYASLIKRGLSPSLVWLVYLVVGALIPQLIHRTISDAEMENPPARDSSSAK